MKNCPWFRQIPEHLAKVETDDDEFLTIEKWPREVFHPHYHEAFNWIVPMRAGHVTIKIDDQTISLTGDEWICIFPYTPHTVIDVSDNLEIFGLFVEEKAMGNAWANGKSEKFGNQRYIIGGKILIAHGLALQWGEYRFGHAARDHVHDHFEAFLCGWLWDFYRPSRAVSMDALALKLKIALGPAGEIASRFVADNLALNPFPWAELTKKLGMSQRSWQRLLGDNMNYTPSELLMRMRVESAMPLLSDPLTPIADIALKCGFSSQAHFSTSFKNVTGTTPGRFRVTLKGEK